jgi:LCP family protein required for cell wall assembly
MATRDRARDRLRSRIRSRIRSRRVPRLVAGVSLILITASGLGHVALDGAGRRISRVDAFGGVTRRPVQGRGTNFLVVGVDGRSGLTPGDKKQFHLGGEPCGCTDTIMLAHLSQDRSRVSVVSLPRDSYAKSAGLPAKLNAAYAEGGPKLTVRAVERMTGVHINHYLEVDFVGFMRTVDLLGGVRVCTARPLRDRYTGLDLPAGSQLLNGGQALQYVRSRHVDSSADLSRMRRQQRFLAQLITRATSSGVLANPVKLGRVAGAVLASVRADQNVGPADLIALARGLRGLRPGSSQFTTVPIADTDHMVKGAGSTVKWDTAAADALWAAIRDDRPLGAPRRARTVEVPPGSIRVRVENGSGVAGLGTRTRVALRRTGFATTGVPRTAKSPARRTVIVYDPRWDRSARSLAAALPGAALKPVRDQGGVMRVTLGAGFAGVTPVKAVPPRSGVTDSLSGDDLRCR